MQQQVRKSLAVGQRSSHNNNREGRKKKANGVKQIRPVAAVSSATWITKFFFFFSPFKQLGKGKLLPYLLLIPAIPSSGRCSQNSSGKNRCENSTKRKRIPELTDEKLLFNFVAIKRHRSQQKKRKGRRRRASEPRENEGKRENTRIRLRDVPQSTQKTTSFGKWNARIARPPRCCCCSCRVFVLESR